MPLLGHVLSGLAEAGITEVGLVVGHHPEAVQRYVGDGDQWGLQATYIIQEKPLGLANAVATTGDFVGDDPFLVYLGDNLLEEGIQDFTERFRHGSMDASLLLKEVEDPRSFGVVVLDENQHVAQLVEKPALPPSNLAIVGVYAFMPVIFEAIANIKPSARGELELTDAIQWLVDNGHAVSAQICQGFWEDAGRPSSLLDANRLYLERMAADMQGSLDGKTTVDGVVSVGKGTRVVGSTLRGPCLIGRNCVIRDSVLGPNVAIGDGCEIIGSVLQDSVVQANCVITDLPAGLQGSVLGEQVKITGDGREGPTWHLVLGDMAQIRMF